MTAASDRFERIGDLFHGALDEPPERRERWLEAQARGDTALLAEVRSLLDAAAGDNRRLDGVRVTSAGAEGTDAPLEPGGRIGAWRIRSFVGAGGMGEVYRAERADGAYDQLAALKLLRVTAAEHLERFHAERQILAGLQHPGIAHLLDGGVTDEGRPWMALEYVEGLPIHEWCRSKGLSLDARIGLFMQVCDAVSSAHASLVVHRDLKPANILVTANGQAKLLDFGIAKLLAAEKAGADPRTRAAPMTPEYAAPEQLDGRPVTTATDVYGLGVTLFELLTGERPFDVSSLPLSAALKTLIQEDAPAASAAAAKSKSPPVPARLLAGDLDAIVAKALRKAPQDRYPTVNALKADLERWRRQEPVSAQPDSAAYRATRFVRRNRVAVAVGLLVASLLAGFTVRLAAERSRAVQAESKARHEAEASREVSDYLVSLFEAASPERTHGQPIEPRVLVDEGHELIEQRLESRPDMKARMLGTLALLYCELGVVKECRADAEAALALAPPGGDFDARSRGLEALSRVEYEYGRYAESEMAGRELVALLESNRETPPLAMATALEVLGQALMEQQKLTEAAELYERSRALLRNPDGSESRVSAETLVRLGRIYAATSRRDEARGLAEKALELTQGESPDEPTYRAVLLDYSQVFDLLGDKERTLWADEQALPITVKMYGEVSAETSKVENNLAYALNNLGREREALPHMLHVVEVSRALGLEETPDFAISISNVGSMLESLGEYEQAEKMFREAMAMLAARPASESLGVPLVENNLGRVLALQHRVPEALEFLRRPMPEGYEGDTAESQAARRTKLLADALVEGGDFAGAAKAYDDAEAAFRRIEDEVGLSAIGYGRARLLHAQGRDAEALPLMRQAVADYSDDTPPTATFVLDAKAALADVLWATGAHDEAKALVSQILPDVQRELAPGHRARIAVERLAAP